MFICADNTTVTSFEFPFTAIAKVDDLILLFKHFNTVLESIIVITMDEMWIMLAVLTEKILNKFYIYGQMLYNLRQATTWGINM